MKFFLLSILVTVSFGARSSDEITKCTETIKVIDENVQLIDRNYQQWFQGFCHAQQDRICYVESEVHKEIIQNLRQNIENIKKYCAEKYGQLQEQQSINRSQQNTPQFQQVGLEQDRIINTEFNILVLCEGPSIEHLRSIISRGNCVLPNGSAYQQPQSDKCLYSSIYLEKGQNFFVGQKVYSCE